MRALAATGIILLTASAAVSQPATSKPAFDIADVHVSPRSDWANRQMDGGFLSGDRYQLRRATMLDLIGTAYNVDPNRIFGGPSWLDYDRFEVTAKTHPGTRPETLRLMLQTLLANRFHLVVKMGTRQVQGYLLSIDKPDLNFKRAVGGTRYPGCQQYLAPQSKRGVQCRNVTMSAFASFLHGPAVLPVLDATGLDGTWDIDLQYELWSSADGSAGGIVEAVDKLGLKLKPGKIPQPGLTVVSVNETPSANPPGLAQALPPLAPPEFEVASVRLCDSHSAGDLPPRLQPGGRVVATCWPLDRLITRAWNLPSFRMLEKPKWLVDSSTLHVTVLAKMPAGSSPDQDTLNAMLRRLLTDRFRMVVHYDDRPVDAYTLVAVRPKLTKADPAGRTGCTRRNPQPEDEIRLTQLVCRNMTMAQFAEQLPAYPANVVYPVLDGTGLIGAWDFTLRYDNFAAFATRGLSLTGDSNTPGDAPDPTVPLTFVDAIQKQLGLKLEVQKRPEPVLVIDRMEERPTEN